MKILGKRKIEEKLEEIEFDEKDIFFLKKFFIKNKILKNEKKEKKNEKLFFPNLKKKNSNLKNLKIEKKNKRNFNFLKIENLKDLNFDKNDKKIRKIYEVIIIPKKNSNLQNLKIEKKEKKILNFLKIENLEIFLIDKKDKNLKKNFLPFFPEKKFSKLKKMILEKKEKKIFNNLKIENLKNFENSEKSLKLKKMKIKLPEKKFSFVDNLKLEKKEKFLINNFKIKNEKKIKENFPSKKNEKKIFPVLKNIFKKNNTKNLKICKNSLKKKKNENNFFFIKFGENLKIVPNSKSRNCLKINFPKKIKNEKSENFLKPLKFEKTSDKEKKRNSLGLISNALIMNKKELVNEKQNRIPRTNFRDKSSKKIKKPENNFFKKFEKIKKKENFEKIEKTENFKMRRTSVKIEPEILVILNKEEIIDKIDKIESFKFKRESVKIEPEILLILKKEENIEKFKKIEKIEKINRKSFLKEPEFLEILEKEEKREKNVKIEKTLFTVNKREIKNSEPKKLENLENPKKLENLEKPKKKLVFNLHNFLKPFKKDSETKISQKNTNSTFINKLYEMITKKTEILNSKNLRNPKNSVKDYSLLKNKKPECFKILKNLENSNFYFFKEINKFLEENFYDENLEKKIFLKKNEKIFFEKKERKPFLVIMPRKFFRKIREDIKIDEKKHILQNLCLLKKKNFGIEKKIFLKNEKIEKNEISKKTDFFLGREILENLKNFLENDFFRKKKNNIFFNLEKKDFYLENYNLKKLNHFSKGLNSNLTGDLFKEKKMKKIFFDKRIEKLFILNINTKKMFKNKKSENLQKIKNFENLKKINFLEKEKNLKNLGFPKIFLNKNLKKHNIFFFKAKKDFGNSQKKIFVIKNSENNFPCKFDLINKKPFFLKKEKNRIFSDFLKIPDKIRNLIVMKKNRDDDKKKIEDFKKKLKKKKKLGKKKFNVISSVLYF